MINIILFGGSGTRALKDHSTLLCLTTFITKENNR